jgi:hypothetical protein
MTAFVLVTFSPCPTIILETIGTIGKTHGVKVRSIPAKKEPRIIPRVPSLTVIESEAPKRNVVENIKSSINGENLL